MTRLFQAMAGAVHGGAEAFFTRLALAFERAGLTQLVAIRPQPERVATLRAGGVAVTELPFGGWLDFATVPHLKRLLRDWRPEIVLTWMNRATALMPPGSFVHAARLGGYYDLKYYRGCQHLIGNTHDIVAYLIQQGWPAERVHYLPNFVTGDAALPIARSALDTPEEAPLLLALGRLHPVKGFDLLVAAMASLPGTYLWIAGDGGERQALRRQVASLGLGDRVRFLGWREDSAPLLASADLLICPSRHEPLGNVVLEAWAQRVPVVATATAGPRQLIRDGETGMLVPVDDAGAIAATVRALLASPERRHTLAAAGHAAFAAEYAEPIVVAAYRDFFDRIAR